MSGVAGEDRFRQMAERTTILSVPAGSILHGLHSPDDRDEVGGLHRGRRRCHRLLEFEHRDWPYFYAFSAPADASGEAMGSIK